LAQRQMLESVGVELNDGGFVDALEQIGATDGCGCDGRSRSRIERYHLLNTLSVGRVEQANDSRQFEQATVSRRGCASRAHRARPVRRGPGTSCVVPV